MDNTNEPRQRERVDTLAVHAGREQPIPQNRASSPALFQASAYEFADLDDVEAIYSGKRSGAIYGRYGGPNGAQFAAAIAELEGAEDAVAAASGMAAIAAALAVAAGPGGTVVAGRELYGGTRDLLENDFQKAGTRVVYVDQSDLEAVRAAVAAERPRVLYLEALTNPLMHVADLPALARVAREGGAATIVDATFATPVLLRPLDHGIDLVLHSVGKYIGGHGDVGLGVVAGRAETIAAIRAMLIRTGANAAHFETWLALRGLRTLALRMERHSTNAAAVAAFLAAADGVSAVHHPSLPGHPQHALAARLYPGGTGGIVAFDLAGGGEAVAAFLRGLRRVAIVHSLGEVGSTISYSVASSHRFVPPDERRALGIGEGTLRLSVGIEHPDDIVADLRGGLAAAGLCARGRG